MIPLVVVALGLLLLPLIQVTPPPLPYHHIDLSSPLSCVFLLMGDRNTCIFPFIGLTCFDPSSVVGDSE